MKTKQILFLTILFAGFIVFASMRPENIPNKYHNFGINDTIDSLNNTNQVKRPRFESVVDKLVEETNQELERKKAELEQEKQELEQLTNRTETQEKELERLRIGIEEQKAIIEKLKAEIKSLTNQE